MPVDSSPDALIRSLAARRAPPARGIDRLPQAKGVDSFDPVVHEKAWWCYRTTMKRVERAVMPKEAFLEGYRNSWCTFYAEAARALNRSGGRSLDAGALPPIVFLYHFPEYPRIRSLLRNTNFLALIKREAVWMKGNPVLPIDAPHVLSTILNHLNSGGRVVAMIDHAFPETHNSWLRFLGRTCSTPTGLISLACRIGVPMGLIRGGTSPWEVIPFPSSRSVDRTAQRILDCLTDWILDSPERWLLWPNLNHRWPGAESTP